jgi:hypothetical protein
MVNEFISSDRNYVFRDVTCVLQIGDLVVVTSSSNVIRKVQVEVLHHISYALLIARFGFSVSKERIVICTIHSIFD